MQNDINALASALELHHPDEGTRSWDTGVAMRRMHVSTGAISAVAPGSVPAKATGMMVRSGVYDVNRFVWGMRNLWAVVVHKDGDDIYYNEADSAVLAKLLDTRFGGSRIFGSDVSYHEFRPGLTES